MTFVSTRARARQCARPPEVSRIEMLDSFRRCPMVMAIVDLGDGVEAVFSVKRSQRRGLLVEAPEAGDRTPGIRLPDDMHAHLHGAIIAAVEADPDARTHLGLRE